MFFVQRYTLEVTEHVMNESLAAAVAIELPFEVALDGTSKGTFAVAGGSAGKGIGFLLFGPAGAIVFSGVGGAGAVLGSAGKERDRLMARDRHRR